MPRKKSVIDIESRDAGSQKKPPRQKQPKKTRGNVEEFSLDRNLQDVKVTVSIRLDGDIAEFFKQRAAVPGAASYQAQINDALRSVMMLASKK